MLDSRLGVKYLELGLKKFKLSYPLIEEHIEVAKGQFRLNSQMAISGILAGEKYSTPHLAKRASGGLVTYSLLKELLEKAINDKDFVKVENILYYINYLKYRLDEKTRKNLETLEGLPSSAKQLIKENQETEKKISMAQKALKKSYYLSSYTQYKYAGKLSKKILDKIIHEAAENGAAHDLAEILDNENRTLPANKLIELAKIAEKNGNSSAVLFFYTKAGAKDMFKETLKELFPLSVKEKNNEN